MFLLAITSFAVLAYTWIVYPLAIRLLARDRSPAPGPAGDGGRISVILATRDATEAITRRVANLRETAYRGPLEVVVACDATRPGDLPALSGAVVVAGDGPGGKAGALNAGVRAATGDVLVFADAGQAFERETIPRLITALQRDPRLGAVSGALSIGKASRWNAASLYWRYERWLRRHEARVHSAVGVTGAVYAMPRALWAPLPPGLILDDLYTPMRLAVAGHRIGLEPTALAHDDRAFGQGGEYLRKTRTLTGVLQLCAWLPSVLRPGTNPIWLQFISHKLLRLLTPWALVGLLVGAIGHRWQRAPDETQRLLTATAFYGCVVLLLSPRLRQLAWGVVLMQLAILRATWNAIRGDWNVWHR